MVEWEQSCSHPEVQEWYTMEEIRQIQLKRQKENSISIRIPPALMGTNPQIFHDNSQITSERVQLAQASKIHPFSVDK